MESPPFGVSSLYMFAAWREGSDRCENLAAATMREIRSASLALADVLREEPKAQPPALARRRAAARASPALRVPINYLFGTLTPVLMVGGGGGLPAPRR